MTATASDRTDYQKACANLAAIRYANANIPLLRNLVKVLDDEKIALGSEAPKDFATYARKLRDRFWTLKSHAAPGPHWHTLRSLAKDFEIATDAVLDAVDANLARQS